MPPQHSITATSYPINRVFRHYNFSIRSNLAYQFRSVFQILTRPIISLTILVALTSIISFSLSKSNSDFWILEGFTDRFRFLTLPWSGTTCIWCISMLPVNTTNCKNGWCATCFTSEDWCCVWFGNVFFFIIGGVGKFWVMVPIHQGWVVFWLFLL